MVQHPCRGVHLDHVADKILLCGNIFPKDHGLFGTHLHRDGSTITIYLEVGFGEAFAWPAELLVPQDGKNYPTELRHSHVVYLWRGSITTGQNEKVERMRQDHWVFPAMLLDTTNLAVAVDKHIECLLDDPVSFQSFPLYRSPLQVLKTIYLYYKKSLPDVSFKSYAYTFMLIFVSAQAKTTPSSSAEIAHHHSYLR